MSDGPPWKVPLDFLTHAILGSLVFAIIGSFAVGLSFCVAWLEREGHDPWIILGLKFAEYTIFAVDLVLLVIFIFRAAIRSVKNL